ncbi:hypothetical protein Agub_g5554 [Astrephomene gubernaculifera]|uniref:Uncharacterized protein n=1 Tax=Astrephomene gubernaculifera TaxID=47775 RepID=A0AAD3DMI7_9CHLO|nr:hypothetical protein Agub_g5554 [Astrephomene gubernaculifera]
MADDSKKHKKSKKQKRDHAPETDSAAAPSDAAANTEGAEAVGDDAGPSGRKWTLSIALPGTLLDNPPSLEYAVFVAAQIARTAAAFQVDEVVVYDDSPAATAYQPGQRSASVSTGTALLARVLQFLDTPPHLRPNMYDSNIMQAHPELRIAAALPAPNPPHHARPSAAWIPYREGVVLKSEPGAGSYVDVGMDRMVWLEHELPQSTRVTVHMGDTEPATRFMEAYSETMILGTAVPPSEPRVRLGLYWGYCVRLSLGLQRVFQEGAVSSSGQYDLTIGSSRAGAPTDPVELVLPRFKHALIVFGGGSGAGAGAGAGKKDKKQGGAAAAAAAGAAAAPSQQQPAQDLDQLISRVPDWDHKAPQDVFNLYLNTTPHLGTLRLRTEDALPVALSYLITPILKYAKQ